MNNIFKPKFIPILFVIFAILFFWQFFLRGLLPIPADTIVGLYHPFRDLLVSEFPRGVPFKNFLITDPVRQLYPWKHLAMDLLRSGQLPLWNPYQMTGTPLLANFQSSPFYPLNIFLLVFPFQIGWSFMVILQPVLAGLFLYLYLRNLKLSPIASLFGGLTFAFCGFSVAWMEWNTVVQTVMWLPLILLSIDKIFLLLNGESGIRNHESREKIKDKNQNLNAQFKPNIYNWSLVFLICIVSSFFAGHLQSFFYVFSISIVYFLTRWVQKEKYFRLFVLFLVLNSCFLILTAIQWVPTLQFILLSARNVDQVYYNAPGWFVPWQNLVQFLVPDFFGNPTTLNYWGIWNYGEFIGYIGAIPFVCAVFAILFRKDKKTLFYGALFIFAILFATQNPISVLPYILKLPFLSTAQPTRLIFVADFALAILAALGFDQILKRKREFAVSSAVVLGVLGIVWVSVLLATKIFPSIPPENISVAKHNLIFPTMLFGITTIIAFVFVSLKKTNEKIGGLVLVIFVLITAVDLIRFGQKFETFSQQAYLFPQTQTIQFLQKNLGNYRFATTDSRIFPPNFATEYRIQSVDGYDPLYLLSYGELIAASERGQPDIAPPFGFNRIITPHNINSTILNLLGVKYVLSLSDINNPQFEKVFQEGETRVYENKTVLPRAFIAQTLVRVSSQTSKTNTIKAVYNISDFSHMTVVKNAPNSVPQNLSGTAVIRQYSPNKIFIDTNTSQPAVLVLTDSYYPTWHARVVNTGQEIPVFDTNYTFRGVIVPKGKNTIEFYDTVF